MYICQIGAKQAGQRLDKLVFSICPDLPGSAFYRALKRGNIKINGRRREISYRVQAGDTLRLYLEPQYLPGAAESGGVPAPVPAGPTFAVVYEDDHVLLADKPAGLLVLPGQNGEQNNLQNQLRHYLQEQGGYRPGQDFAPAVCNRIDRGTSGIVLAAKTAAAEQELLLRIRQRQIHKSYLCAVVGHMPAARGKFDNYLFKDARQSRVYVRQNPQPGAKRAITHWQVLQKTPQLSLVEAQLLTGRTHQIRAQFAASGHPLLGDSKYGENSVNRRYRMKSQALCSYRVQFDWPAEGGPLDYLRGRSFTTQKPAFCQLFAPYKTAGGQ
ncbi:Ribosomal large subunit pseudouridine synthase C [Anaerotruncus sp. 2789STDY5834896]|uniref:Pseudouridine synthase n=1 Tax=uncultured Anaerotruncus sp. TaxID=905011 RepID=A0A1C6GF93_9FIRM|nr:Ribosomal large subunit pseudouridine synthase C [uncultured Anaerotruncus sp.]